MKHLSLLSDLLIAGLIIECIKRYGKKKYEEGLNERKENKND